MKFLSPYSQSWHQKCGMMLLPTLAPLPSPHRQSPLTLVKATRQFYSTKANLSTVSVAAGQQVHFYPQSMHDRSVYWQKREHCSWLRQKHLEQEQQGAWATDGYKSPTCSSPFPLWICTSKKLKAVSNTYCYTLWAHPSSGISTVTVELL